MFEILFDSFFFNDLKKNIFNMFIFSFFKISMIISSFSFLNFMNTNSIIFFFIEIIARCREKNIKTQQQIHQFRTLCNVFQNACVYCYVTKQTNEYHHYFFYCKIQFCVIFKFKIAKKKNFRKIHLLNQCSECSICFVFQQ